MRYFIQLSFDGTDYHGWQIQPNAVSVQQKLNECLSLLLRQPIMVVGAGRTDTGVHARMMVAHFDYVSIDGAELDGRLLVVRLNGLLPSDIAVQQIVRVADENHARFDAVARTYHYDIVLSKNPFVQRFSTRLYYSLDFGKMNEAARFLLGRQDFSSFCKTGTPTKTNNCTITKAEWVQLGPDYWRFEISADRFLRNMVRAVVGTLLMVGQGKIAPAEVLDIVSQKNRSAAGESVPAQGLSLVEVRYPESIFTPVGTNI